MTNPRALDGTGTDQSLMLRRIPLGRIYRTAGAGMTGLLTVAERADSPLGPFGPFAIPRGAVPKWLRAQLATL